MIDRYNQSLDEMRGRLRALQEEQPPREDRIERCKAAISVVEREIQMFEQRCQMQMME